MYYITSSTVNNGPCGKVCVPPPQLRRGLGGGCSPYIADEIL
jgi:hypothetical protein